ncbi:MAG: GntG family PLP-dependent aldolase [Planctomycetota bacterium]|nr:GntG family PLP-dependent aldolase [Planctomycetota bacterium]
MAHHAYRVGELTMTPIRQIIDLRSDTVTRPTAAMWDAMRSAPLGDDVLGDDPTVARLEETIANRLGKESALFTPSGTMANQIAIRCHTQPGDELICHSESHIIHYETGGPAALSGCSIRSLTGVDGLFDADAVDASARPESIHAPRSALVEVENTHNRAGGTIWPIDQFARVAEAAHAHGLAVHLDGARLFNACVAAGYDPSSFASHADTVSVCFSKGLGAPVGSALCGRRDLISRARRFRKMFGGGMRQSGILAAACLHALDHHVARLTDDHANARRLSRALSNINGLSLTHKSEQTPTNMVFFDLKATPSDAAPARTLCTQLAALGVLMLPTSAVRVRAVTHLDVSAESIDSAAFAVRESLLSPIPQPSSR